MLAHVPGEQRSGGRWSRRWRSGVAVDRHASSTVLDAETAPSSAITNCASATGRSSCRSTPADPEPVERAAYDAAYKGVTDALTLYLWRRPAFYLTRWAAQAGLTPNHGHR